MYSSLQLQALLTVCDTGSFDAAAESLHITPSALSQRIATLERTTGRILIRRGRPCTPTHDGRILLDLARQMDLLHSETRRHFDTAEHVRVAIAVNADSITAWFTPALEALARETTIMLDLHIDDESRTAEKLSDGTVMAAVSTSPTAVPGTRVSPLGVLRYLPVAAPALSADLNPGVTPMVRFDVRDDLQHAYLRAIGCTTTPPAHHVPATHEFATAVRAGLGWGMLTEQEAADDLESGSLIVLKNPHPVDVQLY